ncbi:DUF2971 domain-containing protein [Candidatus Poriferisodalis multihospitum]|uniref:DUF2971 domain-containing protein n=1 Tax=Candidatus Poriferisodalis multihospitum TaxID=2983191 RepID=UPI002B258F83|nr:DUF2971 domain-containing protein [Candidatus Poriferisodalis multihospitum]
MDEIYRFRSCEQILGTYRELETQTIFFAEPSALNDPMETARGFVWRGDAIAWTNLFRHYVNCVHNFYFLLRLTEETDRVTPADIAINGRWDSPPTAGIKELVNYVWHETNRVLPIVEFAEHLAQMGRDINADELEFYYTCIHVHVLAAAKQSHVDLGLMDPAEAPGILPPSPAINLHAYLDRLQEARQEEDALSEILEAQCQLMRRMRLNVKLSEPRSEKSIAEHNRDLLVLDFPRAYVQQLARATGPIWYTACFTESYSNTAQWGNYADKHEGVCFVFEISNDESGQYLTLHEDAVGDRSVEPEIRDSSIALRKELTRVQYVERLPEVDFFARISQLPERSLRAIWYTDDEGNLSSVASHIALDASLDDWRETLWSEYRRDICTKTTEWAYEQEHRIAHYSSMGDALSREERLLSYSFSALRGIIFGINTTDENKIAIIDLIRRKCQAAGRTEFDFRQAYYSWNTRQIESYPLDLEMT